MRTDAQVIGAFWNRCIKVGKCWLWTGSLRGKGYGDVGTGCRITAITGERKAHRIAWVLTHGPILDGLFVLHSCDHPACINPDCLFLGDNEANMRDCSAKGRIVISTAKLWKDDVEAIRTLIGQPATKVAAEFGVDRKTIQNIWNDKTWNHTN